MSEALAPTAPGVTNSESQGDRLTFTLFVAIAFHALVILGVGFSIDPAGGKMPTLEITLANHKSATAPEKADFLAQQDQEASGTIDEAKAQTTDQSAEFFAPSINDVNPMPQQRQIKPSERRDDQLVTTTSKSSHSASLQLDQPTPEQEERDGEIEERPNYNEEIASLMAEIDRQRQQYAKRPRVRHLTSVATKSSAEAAYLLKWTDKVEFVGNRNFPEEALRKEIFGTLTIAVRIKPDGQIDRLEITSPSGYRLLDDAAMAIIRDASPFAPIPLDVLKDHTHLEIVRSLSFEISGLKSREALN
ncbi:TonB family protein [Simiduia curdlanivorans]|uniref:Energy transducer TonB n=1 Tax=Simiduia curdlanivorans TaxID=1492769 RepID=A0ABV8V151_9GAMM|nr:TonB family protein [Simiduia curdlanivorans]MDN3637733.1 TonB family protein [Simiduia curdlanivorans]